MSVRSRAIIFVRGYVFAREPFTVIRRFSGPTVIRSRLPLTYGKNERNGRGREQHKRLSTADDARSGLTDVTQRSVESDSSRPAANYAKPAPGIGVVIIIIRETGGDVKNSPLRRVFVARRVSEYGFLFETNDGRRPFDRGEKWELTRTAAVSGRVPFEVTAPRKSSATTTIHVRTTVIEYPYKRYIYICILYNVCTLVCAPRSQMRVIFAHFYIYIIPRFKLSVLNENKISVLFVEKSNVSATLTKIRRKTNAESTDVDLYSGTDAFTTLYEHANTFRYLDVISGEEYGRE